MAKTTNALAAAAVIVLATVTSPTNAEAQWRHGGWHGWHGWHGWRHAGWHRGWHHRRGFPVGAALGGFAAGALFGAALTAPAYAAPAYYETYAYDPFYAYAFTPVYAGPPCVVRRERIWTGWRMISRRVRVCY